MAAAPTPSSNRKKPKAAHSEALPARTVAKVALVCALLVGSSLFPYERIGPSAPVDIDAVEQMPTDRHVASVDDVIELYRLSLTVRPYLSVHEGQIRFDSKLARERQ